MNTCLRCGGFLISERWAELHVVLNRCLNCGDVTDEVIMVNRVKSKPPAWAVAHNLELEWRAELRGSTA